MRVKIRKDIPAGFVVKKNGAEYPAPKVKNFYLAAFLCAVRHFSRWFIIQSIKALS